jgi:hypothetical protein
MRLLQRPAFGAFFGFEECGAVDETGRGVGRPRGNGAEIIACSTAAGARLPDLDVVLSGVRNSSYADVVYVTDRR